MHAKPFYRRKQFLYFRKKWADRVMPLCVCSTVPFALGFPWRERKARVYLKRCSGSSRFFFLLVPSHLNKIIMIHTNIIGHTHLVVVSFSTSPVSATITTTTIIIMRIEAALPLIFLSYFILSILFRTGRKWMRRSIPHENMNRSGEVTWEGMKESERISENAPYPFLWMLVMMLIIISESKFCSGLSSAIA